MVTRPGYIYGGPTDGWVSIGQDAAVSPFKYQATAPTSPATGDIWIDSSSTVNSIDSTQLLRWRKTMVGGETTLSGNDDASLPLTYTPGYEQLYINGVLQVRGVDYTATTGTTVTGLTALVSNDVVEIFSAVARAVSDVYTQSQSDARFVNKSVGGLNIVQVTDANVVVGSGTKTIGANGQVAISGASYVQINNCFTSAYANYRIVIDGIQAASNNFLAQMSANGTLTTTNYNTIQLYATNSLGPSKTPYITQANWLIGSLGTFSGQISIELCNPQTTKNVTFTSQYVFTSSGLVETGTMGGSSDYTTQFDGIRFTAPSPNFTGTIRIYGYNNGA